MPQLAFELIVQHVCPGSYGARDDCALTAATCLPATVQGIGHDARGSDRADSAPSQVVEAVPGLGAPALTEKRVRWSLPASTTTSCGGKRSACHTRSTGQPAPSVPRATCTLDATNDYQAIQTWLELHESPATPRNLPQGGRALDPVGDCRAWPCAVLAHDGRRDRLVSPTLRPDASCLSTMRSVRF